MIDPSDENLIIHPSPNRPGYWAYRREKDDSITEVELTREQSHQLRAEGLKRENSRINVLNQHPLNVAAADLFRQSEVAPFSTGGLDIIAILELAALALPKGETSVGDQAWKAWSDWRGSVGGMKGALDRLEELEITPEDLLKRIPAKAAELILDALGIGVWVPRKSRA